MGNCFKRSFIGDKYLFEPLNSFGGSETEYLNEEIDNKINKKNCSICFELKTRIDELHNTVSDLNCKVILLEKNTQDNFKALSEDINYVNEKLNTSN